MEHGLGLSSVSGLFAVVTALSLGKKGSLDMGLAVGWGKEGEEAYFAGLVLGDLMLGVLSAGLAFAVGAAGFRNVDLVGGGLAPARQELEAGGGGVAREEEREKRGTVEVD